MTPLAGRPRISVCLLAYNHENLIEECVRSVLAQDFSDFELILSDDHSTDGTWRVISALAELDPRIVALRTPRNLGMAGNANFAVSRAAAPCIALLHHDDVYRPDLLRRWLEIMERHPDMGFVSNGSVIHGSGIVHVSPFAERSDGPSILEQELLPKLGSPFRGTALIRRASWDAVGGMRERFGLLADVDLWMRLAARGSVGYVAEPLITVRHARPADYPAEYVGFSWSRQRLLYDIHATNIREHYGGALRGRWTWARFRTRMNMDVTYWLGYSLAKRRWDLLATSDQVATSYELAAVTLLRAGLRFVGKAARRVSR